MTASELARRIKLASRGRISEAAVRFNCGHLIEEYIRQFDWGEDFKFEHEWRVARGHVDMAFGRVRFEWEPPGQIKRGIRQLTQKYLPEEVEEHSLDPYRLAGVAIDGRNICFVRWEQGRWQPSEVLEVSKNSLEQLTDYIRGLFGKILSAQNLAKDFGPGSTAAQEAIAAEPPSIGV